MPKFQITLIVESNTDDFSLFESANDRLDDYLATIASDLDCRVTTDYDSGENVCVEELTGTE